MQSAASRAFSLIELIGVVAVIAILAALAVPPVIREMDQAARTKEIADLTAVSNAIVLQVLSTKTIPSDATWAQSVANWTRYPVSQISTNNRRYVRAFLIDTNGWFGTAAGALPYTQATGGSSTAPTNARIMVIGTIAAALPVASGKPGNASFSDIWNTPLNTTPSTWTTWKGKGVDLFIQRINLDQVFHRLVLVDRDVGQPPPYFRVDTNGYVQVPTLTNVWQGSYLDGSVVDLCDTNQTSALRVALRKDSSYVFQGGNWGGNLTGGTPNEGLAQNFAALAASFIGTQWVPSAHQGGDQQGVLTAMFDFMLVYGLWANQCPHFPWHSASSGAQVPEWQLLSGIGANNQRLDEFSGTSGLLK